MKRHPCCYHNCPREGVLHIGKNGNPYCEWMCEYHLNWWNANRARFLARGLPCEMQELGELLEGED